MPSGPLGGPRPLASSEIVLVYAGDISRSSTLDMSQEERRSVIEDMIRDKTGMRVDVKFTPSESIVLTRREKIPFIELENLIDGIKETNDDLNISIQGNINVIPDGA